MKSVRRIFAMVLTKPVPIGDAAGGRPRSGGTEATSSMASPWSAGAAASSARIAAATWLTIECASWSTLDSCRPARERDFDRLQFSVCSLHIAEQLLSRLLRQLEPRDVGQRHHLPDVAMLGRLQGVRGEDEAERGAVLAVEADFLPAAARFNPALLPSGMDAAAVGRAQRQDVVEGPEERLPARELDRRRGSRGSPRRRCRTRRSARPPAGRSDRARRSDSSVASVLF